MKSFAILFCGCVPFSLLAQNQFVASFPVLDSMETSASETRSFDTINRGVDSANNNLKLDSLLKYRIDEKQKLIALLEEERNDFQLDLEKRLRDIDLKVSSLDEVISSTQSTTDKLVKVLERVQVLEEKQTALEQKTVATYRYNYSSAIVNLASMQREIRPLDLFNSSKDFFSTLESISNPMNYPGYKMWFREFKDYIEENKAVEPKLGSLSHLLKLSGNLAQGTPFAGPLVNMLFDGMSSFIGSLKKKDKELAAKSSKMLNLTATITQFIYDKNLIETEWEAIHKSLEELKTLQDEAIDHNVVEILNIDRAAFDRNFSNETDAIKRFEYIKKLTSLVDEQINLATAENPEKWKEEFHSQMTQIQSLKIRFGTLTFRIMENIEKYDGLIFKYKRDEFLGPRVKLLETKLDHLKSSFESTFNPQEYIKSSTDMYVVE